MWSRIWDSPIKPRYSKRGLQGSEVDRSIWPKGEANVNFLQRATCSISSSGLPQMVIKRVLVQNKNLPNEGLSFHVYQQKNQTLDVDHPKFILCLSVHSDCQIWLHHHLIHPLSCQHAFGFFVFATLNSFCFFFKDFIYSLCERETDREWAGCGA